MSKKFTFKKVVKVVIIVALLSAIGYGGYLYKSKSVAKVTEEVPTFKEQKVVNGDIKLDFTADGEAELSVINADFSIGGKLSELFVKPGQQVKKGDVVAKITDTDYLNKVESAKINYNQAVSKVEQAKQSCELQILSEKQKLDSLKSQLDKANKEYLPMLEIKEYYSKQEIEQKKIAYENAKADYEVQLKRYDILSKDNKDIESAEQSVKSAEISLKTAEDALGNTVLKSPADGKILYISYKVGETVPSSPKSDSTSSDTDHFILLTDSQNVQVISAVSEEDLESVSVGQKVDVEFDAFENETFSGNVTDINPLPQKDSNGIITYDVTVEITNGPDKIKTGMSCSISFILKQKENVIVIPNKAVSMVDGKQTVQVKDKEGKITSKNIVAGLTDGKNTEVTQGLKAGEILVIKEKK